MARTYQVVPGSPGCQGERFWGEREPDADAGVARRRDRLTRCGCHDLQALLAVQARQMEGVTVAENDQAEVVADYVADLVAMVSSFTARLYGQRRANQAKRKTERIAAKLRGEEGEGDTDAAG